MKKVFLLIFLFLIFHVSNIFAATYFPAAGSGSCNWSSTTCWSTTQGGAGSAGVPTSADTVMFEGVSGTNVFNIALDSSTFGTDACKILDMITVGGAANQPTLTLTTGDLLQVAGSITLPSTQGMITGTGTAYQSAAGTVTSNGASWTGNLAMGNASYTLGSNFTINGSFWMNQGTSTALTGLFNLTVGNWYVFPSGTGSTFAFTSGQTLTVTNTLIINNPINYSQSNGTITSPILTIKSGTSSSPFFLNYTGASSALNLSGVTFTDVNASGSSSPLYNYNGQTLTRTVNIINSNGANQGIGQCTGNVSSSGMAVN